MNQKFNKMKSSPNLLSTSISKVGLEVMPKMAKPIPLTDDQTLCGNLDIQINSEGLWLYRGSTIGRKEIVNLFASVLSMDENGRYWLTTPTEKGEIFVEDVPFQAIEMDVLYQNEEQVLSFRTNINEVIIADIDHPIRIETNPETGEPSPYIMVRDRLEARLTRTVFYQLVDLGVEMTVEIEQGKDIINEQVFGVWSSKKFFHIGKLTQQN